MFSKSLPSVLKFKYTGYLTHLYIEMCKNNYLFTDYDMDQIYDMYDVVIYTNHDTESNTKGKFAVSMVRKNKRVIWEIIYSIFIISVTLSVCSLLVYLAFVCYGFINI